MAVLTLLLPQAVDVVGQAGRPKTITGFQTSTTPVLLAYGERAELAVDDCEPCALRGMSLALTAAFQTLPWRRLSRGSSF